MTQTSTKRKNTLIISAIIIVLVVSSSGALIFYHQLTPTLSPDAITVSGKASSGALSQPFPTSLQKIEFVDTQTGTITTFDFPFAPQSNNPTGNYSVSLRNEHTYNVFISYYHGIPPNMEPETNFFTTFTVHAPDGEKAISKDFA
jgi:hypothetical protein